MFDRRRTIDELEALTWDSWSSCKRILAEELHMKRVVEKSVPRLLSENQTAKRLDVCREMKHQLETGPDFLCKIITGDESRCCGYEPETKQQSTQWKSVSICWSASLTSKGSSTMNLYHKVRLLTSCFTLKCSRDCVILCEENAPNCGCQVSGFCITTVLPSTQHWVCGSFAQKTWWQQLRTPAPLLPRPGTQRFFPVSKNEEGP